MIASSLRSRLLALAAVSLIVAQAGVSAPAVRAADPIAPLTAPPAAAPSDPAPTASPTPSSTATPSVGPIPIATTAPGGTVPGPIGLPPTPAATTTDHEIGVGDVESLRTASSQTFANPDGTSTTEFYTTPVFYQPLGATSLEPIQVGFVADTKTDDAITARSDRAPVAVALAPANVAAGFLTTTTAGGQIIGLGLSADQRTKSSASAPTIDGPAADYHDIQPGVDLRVLAEANGAKSFFIWHAVPADPTITVAVSAPGLTLQLEKDGTISFLDAKGIQVARMPLPYAIDSTPDATLGSGIYTDMVSYALDPSGTKLTVSVDPAWLKTAVYPVYVDPTVVWPNAGGLSFGDAHIASAHDTTNYSNYQRPDSPYYHELWLGTDPSGTTGISYDFLKWSLPGIVGTTIDSASINIYPYHQYQSTGASRTVWLRQVTGIDGQAAWQETYPTWTNKYTVTGGWSTTATCTEATTCSFTVTTLVRDWASGTVNYGIKLDENSEASTYWKRLIAAEQGGGNIEHLTVTYHTPTATVVSPTGATGSRTLTWTYADGSAHAQTNWEASLYSDPGYTTLVANGSWAGTGTATTTAIPANVALGNGSTYYWQVRVNDGTSWSPYARASMSWNDGPPTVVAFTAPSTPTAATSLAYSLTFSEPVTGLVSGDFTITGTATGWAVTGITGTGAGPYTVTLGSGTAGTLILSLNQNAVSDGLFNAPSSATPASTVTVDRTPPSHSGHTFSGGSNWVATGPALTPTVWVRTGVAGSVVVTALASDATSGIDHVWFGGQAAPSGWTYVQSADSTAPYTSTISWVAGASAWAGQPASQAVDNAGNLSSAPFWTFTADVTAPTTTFSVPATGTNQTTGLTISPTWAIESETGSGLASRSLQRWVSSTSGVSCNNSWAVDGTAYLGASAAPAQTLQNGKCYQWRQTLTDNLGNSAISTSGTLVVGSIPTVVVTDDTASNPLVYRSGNTVYFGASTAGSLTPDSDRNRQRQHDRFEHLHCAVG